MGAYDDVFPKGDGADYLVVSSINPLNFKGLAISVLSTTQTFNPAQKNITLVSLGFRDPTLTFHDRDRRDSASRQYSCRARRTQSFHLPHPSLCRSPSPSSSCTKPSEISHASTWSKIPVFL